MLLRRSAAARTPAVAGLDAIMRILSDACAQARVEEIPELRAQPGQQSIFVDESADIVVYGGRAFGGKSWGMLLSAIRYVHEPLYTAVIFRRTKAQLMRPGGLWEKAMRLYPLAGATPTLSPDPHFTWPSGATVTFNGLEDEKSKLDWQGSELEFIGFDELTHFTEGQFWYLFGRARSKIASVKPRIRATCNPDPDSFVADMLLGRWISSEDGLPIPAMRNIRKHFVRDGERLVWGDRPSELRARYPDKEPKSIVFIPSSMEDNPIGMKDDPNYASTLDMLPYVERERLKHGNWLVRPTAGNVFNRVWFKIVKAAPAGGREVRYWDKAGTEGAGCKTAGVRMSLNAGRYTIVDVITAQHEMMNRERLIEQTARLDGRGVHVVVEQEPGSSGKDVAGYTIRNLAGFVVSSDRVTGSKASRWMPLSSQASAGNVDVVEAPWNKDFLDAMHNADGENPRKVDVVDAASGAFNYLSKPRLTMGIA